MYFSPVVFEPYWELRGKTTCHVSNKTVRLRCSVPMSLAQLVRLRRLGWACHVVRHKELIIHEVVFSQVDLKRRGRRRTL